MAYRNIQDLLLDSLNGEISQEKLETVTTLYPKDLKTNQLESQLRDLNGIRHSCPVDSAHDLVDFLQTSNQLNLLPQVKTLAKLYLVLPATNAVSERSFSALKRVKSYLRSTMTNKRLNHIMTLHVHQTMTDNLSLIDCANEFVQRTDQRRLPIFGTFRQNDLPVKSLCSHAATQTDESKYAS